MKNKKVPYPFFTFAMIRFGTIDEMFMFAGITFGDHEVAILCFPTAER